MPASVIATIPVGKSPFVVDVNPATNHIYVVNSDDQPPTVSVIDGGTNSVVATVPVGSPCVSEAPSSCNPALNPALACIAVNSQTNKIYIGVQGTSVTVIDGATNDAITVGVRVGEGQPCWMAVNTATNQIYVATSGRLTVIDGATNNVVALTVETEPLEIGVDPVTNMIYVSGGVDAKGNGNITVINGATNKMTTIPLGVFYGGPIAVDSVRNKAYVVTYDYHAYGVSIIDGATLATTAVNNFEDDPLDTPGSIAINVTTNKVYVPHGSGSVSVIDGMTQSLNTVLAGPDPTAVVIDAAINQIYIPGGPSSSPGTVTVIDGASNSTIKLGLGISPGGAALNSATHRVYVTNSCGNDTNCPANGPVNGTVSVIQGVH